MVSRGSGVDADHPSSRMPPLPPAGRRSRDNSRRVRFHDCTCDLRPVAAAQGYRMKLDYLIHAEDFDNVAE